MLTSPSVCGSRFLYVGIEYVKPGESPHRWHSHDYDKSEKFEVRYPQSFEEAYVIINGEGTLYYEAGSKKVSQRVEGGDSIFFPRGMPKHELVNTGPKTMTLVFAGAPPPKIKNLQRRDHKGDPSLKATQRRQE